jgi:hypothetical protein
MALITEHQMIVPEMGTIHMQMKVLGLRVRASKNGHAASAGPACPWRRVLLLMSKEPSPRTIKEMTSVV